MKSIGGWFTLMEIKTAMSRPSLKTVSQRLTATVPLLASLALVGLAVLGFAGPPAAMGQFGGTGGPTPIGQFGGAGRHAASQDIKIKSPAASQVFQRDANGRAAIPIVLDESVKDAEVVDAALMAGGMDASAFANNQQGGRTSFVDGKLVGVPVGGPYTIAVTLKKGATTVIESVGPVFVGDLWVLAGQSNMQGVGNLLDVTPPNNMVMLLGMEGRWNKAEEPLHWLVDSPDPVHSGDAAMRAERAAKEHKTRTKGSGLGLPFAVAMIEQTRIPVGLIACGMAAPAWSSGTRPRREMAARAFMARCSARCGLPGAR